MARKKVEPITDPGVLIPAPPAPEPRSGEVTIILADEHWTPLREVTVPVDGLGVNIIIDRQAYMHAANDKAGRWIFVPTK